MQKLSLITGFVLLMFYAGAQHNPHGKTLTFVCTDCHTTGGWTFSKETAKFSHDKTTFALEGQHSVTDCAACHTTLVFSKAKTNCVDCHTDMHNNTVGPNCFECHTPKSWIVENITEIHQNSRFPLLGAHNTASCTDCHTNASKLEFQPLSIECIDCHRADYNGTTNPNHAQTGLSTNCTECHRIDAFGWSGTGINHDFFPLTKGHEINECASCHKAGVFEPLSPDCFSCHHKDYNSSINPSHQKSGFSTTCTECHTTNPDWKPAEFKAHDALFFPIYSGKHNGEWNKCTDCHSQPENYTIFSCIDCHEHNKSDMDKEHRGENGYSYSSNACFACHPSGDGEGAFNHDATGFSLKGAHIQSTCLDCHSKGYGGTSSSCNDCHTSSYNEAVNPNHINAGISNECETCHTEDGWIPSKFEHTVTSGFALTNGHSGKQCAACHIGTTTEASSECFSCHQANYNSAENHLASNYTHDCLQCHTTSGWDGANFDHNTTAFPLKGAHVATQCSACHTSGYAGTSTLCSSCHTVNYNNAQNPNHTAAGITTECETCHNSTAWIPSEFNHTTTTGFALTGGHSGKQCSACHIGATNQASSECFSCHQANYNSAENHLASNYPHDCLQCHTTAGWEGATFDHNATNFPLTGAHTATDCSACHANGYTATSMLCASCHQSSYNQAVNPNHSSLGFSTNCEDCHTTAPGWEPALLPNHNDYYALNGAHSAVSSTCYLCHAGNYTNTPNTCYACHMLDYNNTKDPAHVTAQFSTDCITCHTENVWKPSTFDHDNQYFPIYSGKHREKWNACADCHTQPTNYAVFSCLTCHEHNQTSMNDKHKEVSGYVYSNANCLACHPTGRHD